MIIVIFAFGTIQVDVSLEWLKECLWFDMVELIVILSHDIFAS